MIPGGQQAIRRKLLNIVVLVTVLALLISALAFGGYQQYMARHKMTRDLAVTAAIVADNVSASLDFGAAETATEMMRSLEAEPRIIAAAVYDRSGTIFATYRRTRQEAFEFPAVEPTGHRFGGGRLELFRPIVSKGQVVGTIFIASDLDDLRDQLVSYGVTGLLIHGLALALIWRLASRLQRGIWLPIQQLAAAASAVTHDKNYSVRVEWKSDDELGSLVSQFNSMLGEIQRRDEALRQAQEELERRVEERTRDLQIEVAERRRAEEALKESEALYLSLVEHIPLAVYRKDVLGRFTFVNHAFCAAYGLTREELLGKSDFDTTSSNLAEKYRRDDDRVMLERCKLALEEKRLGPRGEPHHIQVFKVPVIGSDGNVRGTQGCFFDVTEQRRMREALAYERDLLRTLLDTSPDHIYFKDIDSRFIKCSAALAKRMGLSSPDEIVGKSDEDILDPACAAQARADEQQVIRTGVPIIGKIEPQVWKNGTESWVLTTKVAYRDQEGRIIGTFGISKDITDLKRAEKELNDLHVRLLDSSHKAGMAEVATGVLHNVGNVLNSINVSTTLISERVRNSRISTLGKAVSLMEAHAANLGAFLTQDPKGSQLPGLLSKVSQHLSGEQQEVLREVTLLARHVEHIKEIVSMQQAYAKVSGVREALSAADLVEDALRINSAALVRHEVRVVREFHCTRKTLVDRHKVLQILINLISNAKYAMDAADVDEKVLRISIEEGPDDTVRIIVADNGVGISSENLNRIFEHGFTTRKDGHGFGLHSSALAAKELGGSLSVRSDGTGCGATFTLDLPNEMEPEKRVATTF